MQHRLHVAASLHLSGEKRSEGDPGDLFHIVRGSGVVAASEPAPDHGKAERAQVEDGEHPNRYGDDARLFVEFAGRGREDALARLAMSAGISPESGIRRVTPPGKEDMAPMDHDCGRSRDRHDFPFSSGHDPR